MPIDNLFISGLAQQLDRELLGARIDKIYMPRRDQVVLNLRTDNGNKKLIMSAGTYAAVWLTGEKLDNPDTPPVFCMMLRKQLGNGRIISVTQPDRERIIVIKISSTDEMGDITEKKLICELMGRQKNIIVVNHKGIITACLRNIGLENGNRGIMPGLAYTLPEKSDKKFWLDATLDDFKTACDGIDPNDGEKELCNSFSGLTLALARQGLSADVPYEWFYNTANTPLKPYIVMSGDKMVDISAVMPFSDFIECESFSSALDTFYGKRTWEDNLNAIKRETEKSLTNALKRTKKKIAEQKIEMQTAVDREKIKEKADLITANIGVIEQGERLARVINYYHPDMPEITIELDPSLSPQKNAQKLYKKYARLKSAEHHLSQQIEKNESEQMYLESLVYSLKAASTVKEADEVKNEAREAGFIKKDLKKNKKQPPATPRRFVTDGGFEIICGRNNRENDEITHKTAGKKDIWFHARGVAGSHVVLITDGRQPADSDIEQAAEIAAYYCASSGGVSVPVDYTLVKNVKKPNGARPGQVNYFEYKSVIVKPQIPRGEQI